MKGERNVLGPLSQLLRRTKPVKACATFDNGYGVEDIAGFDIFDERGVLEPRGEGVDRGWDGCADVGRVGGPAGVCANGLLELRLSCDKTLSADSAGASLLDLAHCCSQVGKVVRE